MSLALDYYRNPLAYGHLADGSYPLPRDFADYFSDLCAALSPTHVETTARLLDSSREELEAAARFFARHVLLDPSATWYRCLGASRRTPHAVVHQHYRCLIRLFHPDRLPNATAADVACATRVNAAYQVLGDAERRARYDRERLSDSRSALHSDPRDFFGRHQVPLREPARSRPRPLARRGGVWAAALVAGALLLGIGALLLLPSEPRRLLRSAGEPVIQKDLVLPHYLEDHPTAAAANDPAAAAQRRAARAAGARASTGAGGQTSPKDAAIIGSRVVRALQAALRDGDTASLAALFVEPLPSALALGSILPPQTSAAPMAGGQIRLNLADMAWQPAPGGQVIGRGRALVTSPNVQPRQRRGAVELALIAIDGSYRIHSLKFQED